MDTLALDFTYQPVGILSWEDAITAVVSGRSEVLEEYEERTVRSPSTEIKVPSIIRFLSGRQAFRRRIAKFNRHNVWLRDGQKCLYCGRLVSKHSFTYDHVTPRSQGGLTRWENIVTSCIPCNKRKRDRTPEEAGMHLRQKPYKPMGLLGVSPVLQWNGPMPESWRDYIKSIEYWHAKLEE